MSRNQDSSQQTFGGRSGPNAAFEQQFRDQLQQQREEARQREFGEQSSIIQPPQNQNEQFFEPRTFTERFHQEEEKESPIEVVLHQASQDLIKNKPLSWEQALEKMKKDFIEKSQSSNQNSEEDVVNADDMSIDIDLQQNAKFLSRLEQAKRGRREQQPINDTTLRERLHTPSREEEKSELRGEHVAREHLKRDFKKKIHKYLSKAKQKAKQEIKAAFVDHSKRQKRLNERRQQSDQNYINNEIDDIFNAFKRLFDEGIDEIHQIAPPLQPQAQRQQRPQRRSIRRQIPDLSLSTISHASSNQSELRHRRPRNQTDLEQNTSQQEESKDAGNLQEAFGRILRFVNTEHVVEVLVENRHVQNISSVTGQQPRQVAQLIAHYLIGFGNQFLILVLSSYGLNPTQVQQLLQLQNHGVSNVTFRFIAHLLRNYIRGQGRRIAAATVISAIPYILYHYRNEIPQIADIIGEREIRQNYTLQIDHQPQDQPQQLALDHQIDQRQQPINSIADVPKTATEMLAIGDQSKNAKESHQPPIKSKPNIAIYKKIPTQSYSVNPDEEEPILPRHCRKVIYSDANGQLKSYIECKFSDKINRYH